MALFGLKSFEIVLKKKFPFNENQVLTMRSKKSCLQLIVNLHFIMWEMLDRTLVNIAICQLFLFVNFAKKKYLCA